MFSFKQAHLPWKEIGQGWKKEPFHTWMWSVLYKEPIWEAGRLLLQAALIDPGQGSTNARGQNPWRQRVVCWVLIYSQTNNAWWVEIKIFLSRMKWIVFDGNLQGNWRQVHSAKEKKSLSYDLNSFKIFQLLELIDSLVSVDSTVQVKSSPVAKCWTWSNTCRWTTARNKRVSSTFLMSLTWKQQTPCEVNSFTSDIVSSEVACHSQIMSKLFVTLISWGWDADKDSRTTSLREFVEAEGSKTCW